MLNKKYFKIFRSVLSITVAAIIFLISGLFVSASQQMAEKNVYVKQMGRGYCTLASAVDMMRAKMYIEGNSSWP